MRYISPTQLPELNRAADRAQAMLDALLDDYETLSSPSLEYRLFVLDRITGYIYRLTAIRKTLIALRASMNTNTAALRALTANIREIHDQMVAFKGDIQAQKEFRKQRDKMYASPPPRNVCDPIPSLQSISGGRFAPDWPPATDEIIPEPRIPGRASSPNPQSEPSLDKCTPTAPITSAPAVRAFVTGGRSSFSLNPSPVCSTDNEPNSSVQSDQSHSSHPSHSTTSPDSFSSSLIIPPSSFPLSPDPSNSSNPSHSPDPLDTLSASINSRIPASISDPNFQLPPFSNRAADYAPLYNLDLVVHTPCIPTLPLSALDLADLITSQLNQIESGTTEIHSLVQHSLRTEAMYATSTPSKASSTSISPSATSADPNPLPDESENSSFSPSSENADLPIQPSHDFTPDPPSPQPRSLSP